MTGPPPRWIERLRSYLDALIGVVAVIAFFLLMLEQTHYLLPYRNALIRVNVSILCLFLFDTLLGILLSVERMAYLRHRWPDLIVIVPLVQFVHGIESYALYTVVRQVVIVFILVSRARKSQKFVARLGLGPAQLMITSFFFAVCAGAILLMLPVATVDRTRMPLADALFTACSATCVTGLIVHDTATYFSRFGQLVILSLIQLGGLGIMTFSVMLVVFARKRLDMRQRIVMRAVLDHDALTGATRLIRFILFMTAGFELAGAAALIVLWRDRFPNMLTTAYHATFHSISAFCNAGFSTFSDSFMGFAGHLGTNAVVCVLIVAGGLGFTVVKDLVDNARLRIEGTGRRVFRLRIQTRIVLATSTLLIFVGSVAFYAFQIADKGLDIKTGVLVSVFQSVSSRTAGFNTVDIGTLGHPVLFVMTLLMFIGASPGSTGGGLKTTTFAILWRTMMNGFLQNDEVEIHRRTIPHESVRKAVTVLLFYIVILAVSTTGLLLTEDGRLMEIAFEAVSAVATVGLSTGITPELTSAGKMMVTALMFIGRLGPLTLGYAFVLSRRKSGYRYAEERVMIG